MPISHGKGDAMRFQPAVDPFLSGFPLRINLVDVSIIKTATAVIIHYR